MKKILTVLLVVVAAFAAWTTHKAYSEDLIKLTDEAVMFSGDFTQGSSQRLKFYLKKNPTTKSVVFSSNGGVLVEGINVGFILNDKLMTAYVMEGDKCVSACAFAFLGATRQFADGALAFHAAWVDKTNFKSKNKMFLEGQMVGGYTLYYVMKMGYSSQLAYFIQAKTNKDTFLVLSVGDLKTLFVSKDVAKTPLAKYNNWPIKDPEWLKKRIKKEF